MKRKQLLVQASALALSAFALAGKVEAAAPDEPTNAQTTRSAKEKAAPKQSEASRRDTVEQLDDKQAQEIIVRGVRSSLAKARETKRKSDSIMDVVEAEDIGKLPNNTVGDVIASIPGISVTREEGEVSNIQLRGLNDVQTTIGGTPVQSGISRNAQIQDIPADLVASIQVYKTRSPDQVEGAGAGTINIVLRKPTEFKEGLTVSGNANGRYNTQANRWNQTYTGVFNYRRDTAIGDVGAMLGVTVNTNPVLESAAWNYNLGAVQTAQVVGPQLLPQPTFAPVGVSFRYNDGTRTTPAVNAALQWTPDNATSVALEGNYSRAKFDYFTNWLELPVVSGSGNTLPALSNIKLVPGTNRMSSVTVSPVTRFGPRSWNQKMVNANMLVKLTADHHTDLVDLTSEVAYSQGDWDFDEVTLLNNFFNRPTYDVEFASNQFRYPMMNAQFRDLDMLDPNQYRFSGATQFAYQWSNRILATRSDVTLRTFWDPIEYIKAGLRFSDVKTSRVQFGRSFTGLELPTSAMPEGFNRLVPISPGFQGTGVENNARWLTYDGFAVRNNLDRLRQLLARFSPAFATENIPESQGARFNGREQTIAAYGTVGYRTKLLLPIDGIIGARVTNTIVGNTNLALVTGRRIVNGVAQTVTEREVRNARGNYLNVEPTVTAVIHFTPSLQTRLSYNVGIRRPNVDETTPFTRRDELVGGTGFAEGGNPDLQPERTMRYDAIIEYYFGQVGLITINPYYWKTKGAFARFWTFELLPDSPNGVPVPVNRPYNAGDGYRRGVEVQTQMFFKFLPGIFKNFGFAANATYVDSRLEYTKIPNAVTEAPAFAPLTGVAKNTYNIAALFERGTLNARISYNYNGAILLAPLANPIVNSRYLAPRDWMDLAINYNIPHGPLANLGFSLQVQNALASVRRTYFGYPDQPENVVYMARTYGGTIRYRF